MLLYNPDRKPKDRLISEFVVRTDVFNLLMEDIEKSKMQYPEQHYLIVGQRGAGKTTLLNRIKYAVEDSKVLNAFLIPGIFGKREIHFLSN